MTLFRKKVFLALMSGALACGTIAAADAAGVDGTGYFEIAPTFNGSDGNQSFVRFGNGNSVATTYNVTILGSPSGSVYGSTAIQVPASASPQYALSQILTMANVGALASGDVSYSLYLQDSDLNLSVQHVIFNGANGFFENVSICKYNASANYTGLNSKLANVHTSLLPAYPAQISIHNYSAVQATYNVTVRDSATGTLIGTVPVTIGANATFFQPFQWFETQLNWTPSGAQYHASMVFAATGSAAYEADVGQFIYNQQLAAYVSMTLRCGL